MMKRWLVPFLCFAAALPAHAESEEAVSVRYENAQMLLQKLQLDPSQLPPDVTVQLAEDKGGHEDERQLIITGSPAARQEAKEVIAELDKPLVQFRVAARFVSMSDEESQKFGLVSAHAPTTTSLMVCSTNPAAIVSAYTTAGIRTYRVGTLPPNFDDVLSDLIKQGRTKVVSSIMIGLLEGHAGSLISTTATPLVVDTPQSQIDELSNLISTSAPASALKANLSLAYSIGLKATVITNADGTLTLRLGPTAQLDLQDQPPPTPQRWAPPITTTNADGTVTITSELIAQPDSHDQAPTTPQVAAHLVAQQPIITINNLRDGDSILLGDEFTAQARMLARAFATFHRDPLFPSEELNPTDNLPSVVFVTVKKGP